MPRRILFIQGAGNGAHAVDAGLVKRLHGALGRGYEVIFPAILNEADAQYQDWRQQIEEELSKMHELVVVVAHSVGASFFLKYLSETKAPKTISGLFLLATPFWGGDGWLYDGYEKLELPKNTEYNLPKNVPVFLYHCQDDGVVPYEHSMLYAKLLPHATVRRLERGGHQFDNDLSPVAQDIKNIGFGGSRQR